MATVGSRVLVRVPVTNTEVVAVVKQNPLKIVTVEGETFTNCFRLRVVTEEGEELTPTLRDVLDLDDEIPDEDDFPDEEYDQLLPVWAPEGGEAA